MPRSCVFIYAVAVAAARKHYEKRALANILIRLDFDTSIIYYNDYVETFSLITMAGAEKCPGGRKAQHRKCCKRYRKPRKN